MVLSKMSTTNSGETNGPGGTSVSNERGIARQCISVRTCLDCPRRITPTHVRCAEHVRAVDDAWLREVLANLQPLSPIARAYRWLIVRGVAARGWEGA